jgi:hypothetical protein
MLSLRLGRSQNHSPAQASHGRRVLSRSQHSGFARLVVRDLHVSNMALAEVTGSFAIRPVQTCLPIRPPGEGSGRTTSQSGRGALTASCVGLIDALTRPGAVCDLLIQPRPLGSWPFLRVMRLLCSPLEHVAAVAAGLSNAGEPSRSSAYLTRCNAQQSRAAHRETGIGSGRMRMHSDLGY